MGKYYFLGIGMDSKDGVIKYDDSCQFLDDNRVYLSKLYANGKPKDKHSFVVLDITKLKPAAAKGAFIKKVCVSTTMGVGLTIDKASLAADKAADAQA